MLSKVDLGMNTVLKWLIVCVTSLMLYRMNLSCLVSHDFEVERCLIKGFHLIKPRWLFWSEIGGAMLVILSSLIGRIRVSILVFYPLLSLTYLYSISMYSTVSLYSVSRLSFYVVYFFVFIVWLVKGMDTKES